MNGSAPFRAIAVRGGRAEERMRAVPAEVPVALTYNRAGFAVMMASPADLADFGLGFSVSEGIVAGASEIGEIAVLEIAAGFECRIDLVADRAREVEARRRRLAGPVGCGLCGIESLREAVKTLPEIRSRLRVGAGAIADGFARLEEAQGLNRETRAVHGAGILDMGTGRFVGREDVGRHNALDKAIGAALRGGFEPAGSVVFITSRVSIELVQKCATFGAPILAAISVPTARALEAAEACGLTVAAVARADGFELFTHADRIEFGETA